MYEAWVDEEWERIQAAGTSQIACSCGMRFNMMDELREHNGLVKVWDWPTESGDGMPFSLAECVKRHKLVVG